MTRDQLEHLLRAAPRIAGERDVIVFGSQAILGSFDDRHLPDEAIGSIEADVCFRNDPSNEKSDLVDGAIGELSPFHDTFGICAQGVSITTAILPPGWERRLVTFDTPGAEPGRGLCLDPHDLVASARNPEHAPRPRSGGGAARTPDALRVVPTPTLTLP